MAVRQKGPLKIECLHPAGRCLNFELHELACLSLSSVSTVSILRVFSFSTFAFV